MTKPEIAFELTKILVEKDGILFTVSKSADKASDLTKINAKRISDTYNQILKAIL